MLSDAQGRLTIGELARRVGVSTRTVRYYEELGILPPAGRTQAGTRTYPSCWTAYLEGALVLKDLGFALDEIRTITTFAYGSDVDGELRDAALTLVDDRQTALARSLRILDVIRARITDGAAPLTDDPCPVGEGDQ